MRRSWPVAAIRAAEQVRLGQVPEGALMQRAAAGLATVCAAELRRHTARVTGRHVVLLVGPGNNGGDALFAGERLARRGVRVDAVLVADPHRVHPGGLVALRAAGGRVRPRIDPAADLVVDGIVGLGASGGLREDALAVLTRLPARTRVVAVDLPSGVDPDTGELPEPAPDGTARHLSADVTVTFGAEKNCLLLPPGDAAAGQVHLVDLGLGPLLTGPASVERFEDADVAAAWPAPGPADHKYRRGVLGVVAGSDTYPGAAVLVVEGAARTGLGMVRYLGPDAAGRAVLARRPETVPAAGRVQAWVVGSGIDPGDAERVAAARQALADGLPAVVDAGALGLLTLGGAGPVADRPLLLTPHAGELVDLLTRGGEGVRRDQVEAAPLRYARRAAALTGATVLLKGPTTVVVDPAGPDGPGRVLTQAEATPWLGTAGAGDVLAGICGALLAAGLPPVEAGALAASVHGRAARGVARGGPIAAHDVADAVPDVVRDLLHAAGPGDPGDPPRSAPGGLRQFRA